MERILQMRIMSPSPTFGMKKHNNKKDALNNDKPVFTGSTSKPAVESPSKSTFEKLMDEALEPKIRPQEIPKKLSYPPPRTLFVPGKEEGPNIFTSDYRDRDPRCPFAQTPASQSGYATSYTGSTASHSKDEEPQQSSHLAVPGASRKGTHDFISPALSGFTTPRTPSPKPSDADKPTRVRSAEVSPKRASAGAKPKKGHVSTVMAG
jgi:hypothetical protein